MPFNNTSWASVARRLMYMALVLVASAGLSCKPSALSPDDAGGAGNVPLGSEAAPAAARNTAGADRHISEQAARRRARAWLTLIDRGDYSESWTKTSAIFQAATGKAQWRRALQGSRAALGEPTSREFRAAQHETTLLGAPAGQYVIVHYDTAFADSPDAREVVTLTLAPDESWKVVGYFVETPGKR